MTEKKDRYLFRSSKYFYLFCILFQTKISKINRIYYIDYNYTSGLKFFFKKIKFVNCNKFEESRIKVENKHVHLHIWQLLTELSNKFIQKSISKR